MQPFSHTAHFAFQHHERSFEANRFVYPVVSRRAQGVSVGVNLNPDKACNFDCIYCQVDRRIAGQSRFVAMDLLLTELDAMIKVITTGELYRHARFADVPAALRRLNDIAFSGDGEPTTYRNFDVIVAQCAELKKRRGLGDVKMVLITNASMFHRACVQRGLRILDENQGEIWAKLEAGTQAYFELVDRTTIPLRRIVDNITLASRTRPLVIQALFMRIRGEPPPDAELREFCARLNEITASGGQIKLVQVYTVARPPAESFVSPLPNPEVDRIADIVRRETGLPAATFYGAVESAVV